MLFAATLLAGQLYGTAQAVPLARVAAVVNGDMITERELNRAVAPQLAKDGLDSSNPRGCRRDRTDQKAGSGKHDQ